MLSRSIAPLLKDFFEALSQRSFAEAERSLEKINGKAKDTEWYRGFISALDGMVIALKTNDRYTLINQIKQENVKGLMKDFSIQSKSTFQTEFDKGYFTAWVNYLKSL